MCIQWFASWKLNSKAGLCCRSEARSYFSVLRSANHSLQLVIQPISIKVNFHSELQPSHSFFLLLFKQIFTKLKAFDIPRPSSSSSSFFRLSSDLGMAVLQHSSSMPKWRGFWKTERGCCGVWPGLCSCSSLQILKLRDEACVNWWQRWSNLSTTWHRNL